MLSVPNHFIPSHPDSAIHREKHDLTLYLMKTENLLMTSGEKILTQLEIKMMKRVKIGHKQY